MIRNTTRNKGKKNQLKSHNSSWAKSVTPRDFKLKVCQQITTTISVTGSIKGSQIRGRTSSIIKWPEDMRTRSITIGWWLLHCRKEILYLMTILIRFIVIAFSNSLNLTLLRIMTNFLFTTWAHITWVHRWGELQESIHHIINTSHLREDFATIISRDTLTTLISMTSNICSTVARLVIAWRLLAQKKQTPLTLLKVCEEEYHAGQWITIQTPPSVEVF